LKLLSSSKGEISEEFSIDDFSDYMISRPLIRAWRSSRTFFQGGFVMRIRRKHAVLAGAFFASISFAASAKATVAFDTSPVSIDGWTISWPTPVALAIQQDGTTSTQVDVEKKATFSAPGQGFQITFAASPSGTTANAFVIPQESITNDTGAAFSSFSFIILNTGTANATFAGPGFTPPTGTGYNFTSVSLVNGGTELDYIGTQGNGVTSLWGDGTTTPGGNNLVIDAPAGSDFSLKELAGSGGPPGPPAVPLPASAWQCLISLGGLGLIAGVRSMKKRRLA
jgi:hypothetical protein